MPRKKKVEKLNRTLAEILGEPTKTDLRDHVMFSYHEAYAEMYRKAEKAWRAESVRIDALIKSIVEPKLKKFVDRVEAFSGKKAKISWDDYTDQSGRDTKPFVRYTINAGGRATHDGKDYSYAKEVGSVELNKAEAKKLTAARAQGHEKYRKFHLVWQKTNFIQGTYRETVYFGVLLW